MDQDQTEKKKMENEQKKSLVTKVSGSANFEHMSGAFETKHEERTANRQ